MRTQKTHLSRPIPSFLLAVLAWLACAVPLSAQVSTFYSFAQSSGTQTLITGGTKLNTGNNFNEQVYTVTIPSFFYDGSYHTTMYVSANGFITFGAAPAGDNYTPLSSTAGYTGAIAPFGADLRQSGSGTREVRWQQVGNEIVVQWQGARRYDSGTGESFTVQARLHTVTGVIQFVYSGVSGLANGTHDQPQVGLRGPNNTFATNVNNRMVTTGGNNWNTSIVGTANNSTCRFTNTSPARSFTSGQTYTWTPACMPPTITATSSNSPVCPTDQLTLGVTATGPSLTYAWTGTGTFSPNNTSANVTVTGAATGTYSVTVTSNGCTSVANIPVVVNPVPTGVTANSSAASVCSDANTVNLTGEGISLGTILSQGFNSGIAPWTTTNTSTGGTPANAAWTARPNNYLFNAYDGDVSFSSNDASQFVLSNSDAQGSGGTTATTLVSPAFSTVGYTSATLTYYHYYRYNSGTDDRAHVEVSTDGSNWTTLQTHSSVQGAPTGFVQATVSLNGYLNQANLQVRFRYNASWDYFWAIDNVSITGTSTAHSTFAWTSTPPGFTSSVQNPTGVAVTQNTTYTLTVTSPSGCTTTANTAVSFVQAPSATIAYTRSAYCTSASSANVTRSGTPGGTYSSTAGLTINASTGTVTPSTSTPGTYTITYTIAAAPPCGQFQTTTQLTIDALPTAAAAGSDQSTCAVDAITLAANTPVVGIGDWSVVSGPSTNLSQFANVGSPTSTFLSDGGPGTYILRWSIDNGACSPSTDDVVITVNACTYYSRNTGDVADPIWSLTPAGAAGPAIWDAATNMVVQNGHTVTNTSALQVGSITVDAGGTLVLGAFNLTANGAVVDINGTLTANDNSTLTIAGNGAKTLDLSAATSFYDLTCNAASGTTLTGNATIRNTLLLQDGAFDCTGNAVVLASTANSTGRLGPVGAGASYVGDLTVNRYIPAGATNWRMMGSPVAGQTVNQWKDDYYTAGFPGSHSPTFSNPVGSGILWPSIRWYDETNTGANVNDGLVGATSTAQSLAAGQGFAAWCGTGLNTTTAFNVDVTGNPHVAHTPIALPMSYTNTGVAATDGWNMVSNPLASPIAFDLIDRGADVADYITYFNTANGNLATWDISDNIGTNGGSNVIQSSQAFWLKATGPAVTTTVDEQDKVAGNTGGFFGGAQVQTANLVRLRIESAINQYSDETVVLFSSGQPGFDGNDVPKFVFAHPEAPQIASLSDGGDMVAINAYGPYSTQISIPVKVDVAVNGTYTIVATGLQHAGLSCMRLEDLATGVSTPLFEGATYSFAALSADNVDEPRFVLHATAPIALTATDATCHGRDDGSASLQLTSGPVDVSWADANGVVVLEQNAVLPGNSDLVALPAGEYSVHVSGDAACGTLSTTFVIEEPAAMEAEAITLPSTCPDSEDGTIGLTVLGGVAPYTYLWSNEATTGDIEVAAGSYTVLITDANGCTFAPQAYVVGAGEGPDAGISVEGTLVLVGEDILFTPNTIEGVANTWDFGDGSTSNDLEAVHSYAVPGSYTITLSVDNGECVSTASIVVDVQTGTGVPTVAGHSLNAYVSGDHIVVDHDFSTQHPVIIRVISTSGQLVQEHRVASAPARITLPASDLASGVWLVRVSSGEQMRTFSLPIVH